MKIEILLTVNYLAMHTFVKTKYDYEKTTLLSSFTCIIPAELFVS